MMKVQQEKSTDNHMKFSIFINPFHNGPQILWSLLWWQGLERVTKESRGNFMELHACHWWLGEGQVIVEVNFQWIPIFCTNIPQSVKINKALYYQEFLYLSQIQYLSALMRGTVCLMICAHLILHTSQIHESDKTFWDLKSYIAVTVTDIQCIIHKAYFF